MEKGSPGQIAIKAIDTKIAFLQHLLRNRDKSDKCLTREKK
jgi:hypothetical protein